ncbi:MAG TPA: hypothetical protein VG844_19425 [Terracidiphilus sp.]|nr:hypothetical protein [Terracidiphilus sp.]
MGKRVEIDLLTYSKDGFPSFADVAKKYDISGGVLREADKGVTRTYLPFTETEIPHALARVSTGEITPLEFASRYGLLGFSSLVRPRLLPTFSSALPKSAEWRSAHTAYRKYRDLVYSAARSLPDGDPLDWFMAQSRTVALCLQFAGLLNEGDETAIKYEVESLSEETTYARGSELCTLPVQSWRKALKRRARASAIIRAQLSHTITENVAGVQRVFLADPFGARIDSLFSGTVIEAVYWQIGDKMEARTIVRCHDPQCARFFIARDKRQQYCPPLPGSKRSRCSSRLNVKNFRDRQE